MRITEEIIDLMKVGKHFCILPWIHLHVSTSADMLPCCQQSYGYEFQLGNLNEHSFTELWQGNAMRQFRLKMLRDEECMSCKNCYLHESAGIRSLRKLSNFNYQQYIDWVVETDETGYAPNAKPVYWDIRFSNTCNLKCRTCDLNNSSSWYKDKEILLGKQEALKEKKSGILDSERLLRELDTTLLFVEELYFAGGEPLLFKENLKILEKLDARKRYDMKLVYNTNGTLLNQELFLGAWKKFTDITVLLSMDGSHERGEYLRTGSVWSVMESNLRLLKKECPHVKIIVNFTVSLFNIFHLPEFHKEMVDKKLIQADELNLNILNEPECYNIRILPEDLKNAAAEKLTEHISWIKEQEPFQGKDTDTLINRKYYISKWFSCIHYMQDQDWQNRIPEFIERTTKVDEIRNENFLEVFPELRVVYSKELSDSISNRRKVE